MRISSLYLATALGIGLAAPGCSPRGDASAQLTFDTPEAAVEAMFKAISTDDTTALLALTGPDSRDIVIPADQVQAARERQVIAAAMMERWWLEGEGNTRTLVIGNESYPTTIPLVEKDGKWRFNTAEGREELLYRRVGRNELTAMEVAAAFVEAQREYAAKSHDGVPRGAYAQRFLSDSGRHNGLYWPQAAADTVESPMGELAAKAAGEGYGGKGGSGVPYHGYYFKVLTGQGPSAPGGARSWVVNGAMSGGYAMLAWPAEYGSSGVMTFMIGPDDVVRQQDLGDGTPAAAAAITAFDPDSTWSAP